MSGSLEYSASLLRSCSQIAPYLREMFPLQRRFVLSGAKRKTCTAGRRGGKTEGIVRLAALGLDSCGFEEVVHVGAKTAKRAKQLYWAKLKSLAGRHGLPWTFRTQDAEVLNGRGGLIRLVGAKDLETIELLRGDKTRLSIWDEFGGYPNRIAEPLMRDVVEPSLSDLGGSLVLAGTPGPVLKGYYYEACTSGVGNWENWNWDMRANELFPRPPEEALAEARDNNGWTGDEATYRREYMGEWCIDDSVLVYRYLAERNLRDMPDDYDPSRWVHTIGVDFGLRDETAWTVLASHPHRRESYVVYSAKEAGLLQDDAADRTLQLVEKYTPEQLVGDAGGLGAPYVAAYNRIYGEKIGYKMRAARKTDKRGTIDLLNTELRAARVLVVRDVAVPLSDELDTLPWNDGRTEPDKRYDDHCADSFLYAWRHHYAYLHEQPSEPRPGSSRPDSPEVIAAEERELGRGSRSDWWDDE